ncbi:MAG: FAD binding domain-containing protein [Shinella sp.]|nr:FAD binding domain-containing protein [Shinella sp.]
MGLTLQTFPTVADAARLLAGDPAARYLGGGTLLVRHANEGDTSFSAYVRTTDPGLSAIMVADGSVRLGASVTMAAVARHPELAFLAPAARAVGGPAIRNMATVGGNLFAPTPYGDFGVALLALDAMLDIDETSIPAEDFFASRQSYGRSIIRFASFPLAAGNGLRFLKASRIRPKGASVVTIAAVVREEGGKVADARIAFGCMADRPIRAKAAEKALIGQPLTAEGIKPALAAALEGTAPVTDAIASAWYRSEVLPVHLGRLLLG